jgi:hypothetical protein
MVCGSGWGVTAVNPKQIISGASYGPDALKAIGQAFDEAWFEIAGNFGTGDIEKARLRLARALLSIANEDSRDVGVLRQAVLERMALDYRTPSVPKFYLP